MKKRCLLVNISGFFGRPRIQRKKIKVGNAFVRLRAGNVLEVDPAVIEAYPEQDELTESVNPKDWEKKHIFLVIRFDRDEDSGKAKKQVNNLLKTGKSSKTKKNKIEKKKDDTPPQLADTEKADDNGGDIKEPEKVENIDAPPVGDDNSGKTENDGDDKKPEETDADEDSTPNEDLTYEYVHEHPTIDNFMKLGESRIHKYKLEYKISIKGYNSMSLKEKAKFLANEAKKES